MTYATGGSCESISLDGREMPCSSDAEVQRKLGGFENEILGNGNGTARVSKTRVPWSLAGIVVEADDNRGDHEFLQEIADSKRFVDISITYASGATYQGKGTIEGEMSSSSKTATASFGLGGSQKLTKQ